MAIRLSGSSQYLNRTSDILNHNNNYTLMMWVYPLALSGWPYVCEIAYSDWQNGDHLTLEDKGATQVFFLESYTAGSGSSNSGTTDLAVSTWYHVAVVRSATNSLSMYLNGALEISLTNSISGRSAPSLMNIGCQDGGYFWNGRMQAIKAWTAALSVPEILAEMRVIRPIVATNLYGFWPCWPGSGERVRDYSGNGRNWTENGTVTDEDPAPISWGGHIWVLPYAASGISPTTINLSAAALSASGQTIDQQSGAVSKAMSAAALSAAGQTVDQQSGAVSKALAAAALSAAGQAIDQQSGAVSKALAAAALSAAGQAITISLGGTPISINFSAAALAATGQTIDQQSGAVSKALTAAALSATGQVIDQQSGAVSKALAAAALSASGQTITIFLGGAPISINISAAALSAAGQTIDQQSGAVSKALAAAALSASGQAIDIQAITSIMLSAGAIAAGGQSITVTPGAMILALSAAALSAGGQTITISSGVIALIALTLYARSRGLTIDSRDIDMSVITRSISLTIESNHGEI